MRQIRWLWPATGIFESFKTMFGIVFALSVLQIRRADHRQRRFGPAAPLWRQARQQAAQLPPEASPGVPA